MIVTTQLSDVAVGYFGHYPPNDGLKLDVLEIKISNISILILPIFQTADGERITEIRTTIRGC